MALGTSSTSGAVVMADSVPTLVSLTPGTPLLVAPGGTRQFTLTLDSVALYDTLVEVVAVPSVPEEPYGSVPVEVVVPTGQSSATFTAGTKDGAECGALSGAGQWRGFGAGVRHRAGGDDVGHVRLHG